MKIGDKVRVKESLAGAGFSFSDGEIVTLDSQNIALLEGLLRGGSAEMVDSFPEVVQGEQPQPGEKNENIDILPDDGTVQPVRIGRRSKRNIPAE
jgi:hypothetical protein